jgi:hypothetical protein
VRTSQKRLWLHAGSLVEVLDEKGLQAVGVGSPARQEAVVVAAAQLEEGLGLLRGLEERAAVTYRDDLVSQRTGKIR